MARPIEEGDSVKVYWVVQGNDETWTEEMDGVVVHAPCDTGDSWYIEDEHGTIHMINHRASSFLEMLKMQGVIK